MHAYEELFALERRLASFAEQGQTEAFASPLIKIVTAADRVAQAFSGSWLGYHARVYYADLKSPPPGAAFSQEWGLEPTFAQMGSRGDWREYSVEEIRRQIFNQAGDPDLSEIRRMASDATLAFDRCKAEALSILSDELTDRPDGYLDTLRSEIGGLQIFNAQHFIDYARPKGQFLTRDRIATGQGISTPPHISVHVDALELQAPPAMCASLADKIAKAASHIERLSRRRRKDNRVGTNVFIGHGRSPLWRELKDFVEGRLKLPWDEFNRVPVAGVTNIARLSEMLDAAAVGLLVMTAEDELAEGGLQARMNVVHEAGLFQGRLGFTKAIVLLEEGCAEFSNIQGLGQIRFPKGNIGAAFEDVRRVLERENLIESP